ncbi:hypothetical protein [Mesorhizobium sp. B1-1-5]|uniref:hypothetical protein n=1 Tax=Mesorhizobium sp. B1-1-5 TaxID=2589979 RepID=UPI0011285896|nr:hypothetical protein [Mesorhizobium sp. B1-1-5]TPO13710.1 hypothetical protein FJ980_00570 [Mesorhizobium sp. B1-1-5]
MSVGDVVWALSAGEDAAAILLQLQETFSTIETGYRVRKQQAVLRTYAIASYLRGNHAAWLEFCGRPEWDGRSKRPTPEKSSFALRYALRFAIGPSDAATKDVSRYFRILRPHFDRQVPVEKVEEMMNEAGGLVALGKPPKVGTATPSSDDPKWTEDDYRSDLTRLLSENQLADRGTKKANVDDVLDAAAAFHDRNVVVPRRLACEAEGISCLRLLLISAWLVRDRDAWDEFCRSKLWIDRKRKPNLNRPREAFHFILLVLAAQTGVNFSANRIFVAAEAAWLALFDEFCA